MSQMIAIVAEAILAKVPLGYGMTNAEAVEYASVAIEAMREPTDEMLHGQYGAEPRRLFTAMIDEALK